LSFIQKFYLIKRAILKFFTRGFDIWAPAA